MSKPYFWPVLLIAVLLVPISGSAREPSNFPVLRVETGAHTANVTGLAIAGDGQTMASASFDKTVRIWSLEHPGLPLRTIRVPIA